MNRIEFISEKNNNLCSINSLNEWAAHIQKKSWSITWLFLFFSQPKNKFVFFRYSSFQWMKNDKKLMTDVGSIHVFELKSKSFVIVRVKSIENYTQTIIIIITMMIIIRLFFWFIHSFIIHHRYLFEEEEEDKNTMTTGFGKQNVLAN